jgi:hypothetical protein
MSQHPNAIEILLDYVRFHNEGVKSGSFDTMAAIFGERGELTFAEFDIGPFIGSEAVRNAFSQMPPDDLLQLGSVSGDEQTALADYGWARNPGRIAGKIVVEVHSGGEIHVRIVGVIPQP